MKQYRRPGRQTGLSPISLAFLLGLLAFFVTVTIKILPLYLNQMKVANAITGIVEDPEVSASDALTIRDHLKSRWIVNSIDILTPYDVKVKHTDKGRSLVYDYENRTHLFYNIDLIIHFQDERPLPPARNE